MTKPSLLIVDDEKHTRSALSLSLKKHYLVSTARDALEALELMQQDEYDLVLTDLRMGETSGLQVIENAKELANQPACIVMTAYGDIETAVNAMKAGAVDFITKPLNLENLQILLERALESRNLRAENKALHKRLDATYNFQNLIGHSRSFKELLQQLHQVASAKATVLLQGPTGTGKELAAQAIHQNSPRARKPFIAVHCASLPANLLESELFGYEKGAFTGATERRKGRFEAAHQGTLFLDEIGEIDATTQVKLLRFLENRTFERLGSIEPITVDVRLIVATHRDLKEMVKQGTFREDLFYRLSTVPIDIPSLKDRAEDIPLLLNHYLKHFAEENGITTPTLSPEAKIEFLRYDWPGNIRELRNICENLVVLHPGQTILATDLPFATNPLRSVDAEEQISPKDAEIKAIEEALRSTKGNKTQAAALLNMSRRTLHRKLLSLNRYNEES